MHSDKQNQFLTTFKKWVLAKKSFKISHSAPVGKSTPRTPEGEIKYASPISEA